VIRKENPQESQNRTTPEDNVLPGLYPAHQLPTSMPEALLRLSLPSPGEIVTADVSWCGNEGAGEVCSGGDGWAIKNTRNKEREI